jgi:hypothetical protein
MEIEKQVCFKGQGEEFKNFGVEAKSYFVWERKIFHGLAETECNKIDEWELRPRHGANTHYPKTIINAYSSAELDALLPKPNFLKQDFYCVNTYPFPGHLFPSNRKERCRKWRQAYDQYARDLSSPVMLAAHAKATLLIELIKHKLVDPKELKL